MASDSPAGGAPDDMPVAPSDSTGPESSLEVTLETLQRVIDGLQTENADLNDKYLRAVADSHNIRRRGQQDVEKERKFAVERFARDMLSVADNLGRALSALPASLDALDPAVRNVVVGVQATERELLSVLERHGVTRIEAKDKPFNAEFHQAVMEIEDASVPTGTVVQELAPGYLLAGRLLRAAMVGVSKGGPQRMPEPRAEASNENNEP
jgi:molecular chaperone GrpE